MITIGTATDITQLRSNNDLLTKTQMGICSVFLSDYAEDGPLLWNDHEKDFKTLADNNWHILVFSEKRAHKNQLALKDLLFKNDKTLGSIKPPFSEAGLLFFNPHRVSDGITKNSKPFWVPFNRAHLKDPAKTSHILETFFDEVRKSIPAPTVEEGEWWKDPKQVEHHLKRLKNALIKNRAIESDSRLATVKTWVLAAVVTQLGEKMIGASADPIIDQVKNVTADNLDLIAEKLDLITLILAYLGK